MEWRAYNIADLRNSKGERCLNKNKEIAAAVSAQLGLEIDKKKMQLSEPIKTLGTHIIPVKLYKEVTGELTVKVVEQ